MLDIGVKFSEIEHQPGGLILLRDAKCRNDIRLPGDFINGSKLDQIQDLLKNFSGFNRSRDNKTRVLLEGKTEFEGKMRDLVVPAISQTL